MKKTIVLFIFSLVFMAAATTAMAVHPVNRNTTPTSVTQPHKKALQKQARMEKRAQKLEKRLAKKSSTSGAGLVIVGLILLALAIALGVVALIISLAGIIPLTATLLALAGVGLLVWGIVELLT
ncbi:MAG: hypothetical protein KDC85_24145 [Saprospiraceae bacterium]|nr:hypothetical protein [Saprospiraceae bacterium]MCB9323683.1 hypothetical protein [Lewinellaceae bacterium]